MNVQHALASSRLTPVEWADLWRRPSSMSRARSAQQWSRLNVWSNAETRKQVLTAQLIMLTNTVQWS